MTRANEWIAAAARRAEAWPLARMAAAMLAAAAAFFCYAMPGRLLAVLLGPIGAGAAASAEGRIAFVCFGGLLAGGLGWLAVAAAAGGGGDEERESDVELETPPRRRPIGPSNPSEALNAPPPALLAVRRGDGHPDAPPRRPIFAHELGSSPALPEDDRPLEAAEGEPVAPDQATPAPDAPDTTAANEDEPPAPADGNAEEPLELVDAIDPPAPLTSAIPAPASPPAEEPSLAALMARFERGLDGRAGRDAVTGYGETVSPIRTDPRSDGDALRDALAALQRMAARQR